MKQHLDLIHHWAPVDHSCLFIEKKLETKFPTTVTYIPPGALMVVAHAKVKMVIDQKHQQ